MHGHENDPSCVRMKAEVEKRMRVEEVAVEHNVTPQDLVQDNCGILGANGRTEEVAEVAAGDSQGCVENRSCKEKAEGVLEVVLAV